MRFSYYNIIEISKSHCSYVRNKPCISNEYVWCMCLRIVCSIGVAVMWNLAFRLFRARSVKTSPGTRKNLHHGGWWLGRHESRKTGVSIQWGCYSG